tara:strand:+ start:482 stop:661 length:180 start_codon:yes stop_codon:yes gene_type:complete
MGKVIIRNNENQMIRRRRRIVIIMVLIEIITMIFNARAGLLQSRENKELPCSHRGKVME